MLELIFSTLRTVIVRKLPSVETLGCTSVICTDKTGTLTTNEMTAVSLVLFEKKRDRWTSPVVEHAIQGSSYSPLGSVDDIISHEEVRNCPYGSVADIAAVSALCNDAKIVGNDNVLDMKHRSKKQRRKKRDSKESEKIYERVGEPTEGAL